MTIARLTASAIVLALATPAIAGEEEAQSSAISKSEGTGDLPIPLADKDLEEARGRVTLVVNQQDLDAIVSDNSIGDYAAGNISLGDNALGGLNGVGNFVFNTGAQNNLQAGMTLTVTIGD